MDDTRRPAGSGARLEGLRPCDLAGRLAGDCVFFDGAQDRISRRSIVAWEPVEVLRGSSPAAWEKLATTVAGRTAGRREGAPRPDGLAAGCVDYDGTFAFGIFQRVAVYEHGSGTWHLSDDFSLPSDRRPQGDRIRPEFRPGMSRSGFCERVRRAQEYIRAGDIYQVNLSHRLSACWEGDAFSYFKALRRVSPAPYASFLRIGGREVVSASPELFLEMQGGVIRTCPIKGTRPRKREVAADERSAQELRSSAKEIAELIMITDLERNDLGQVCEFGSIEVTELLKLERYEQVFHLVSTVEGRLRADVDHVHALRKCFPGGSITGAPKRRAMEIIAELEPVPRGLYTGAIGYFGLNGGSRFSMAIRTAVAEAGELHFHVGAGIVADSLPGMEYQETMDKAAGLLLAAGSM